MLPGIIFGDCASASDDLDLAPELTDPEIVNHLRLPEHTSSSDREDDCKISEPLINTVDITRMMRSYSIGETSNDQNCGSRKGHLLYGHWKTSVCFLWKATRQRLQSSSINEHRPVSPNELCSVASLGSYSPLYLLVQNATNREEGIILPIVGLKQRITHYHI